MTLQSTWKKQDEEFEERFTTFYFEKETFEPRRPVLLPEDVEKWTQEEIKSDRLATLKVIDEWAKEETYEIKEVDWGDGIKMMENAEDDTKSNHYTIGYNQALQDLQLLLKSEIDKLEK